MDDGFQYRRYHFDHDSAQGHGSAQGCERDSRDRNGKQLFQQTEVSMIPVVVNGENTYHAELYSRLWGSYESFYGLGQHQAGV